MDDSYGESGGVIFRAAPAGDFSKATRPEIPEFISLMESCPTSEPGRPAGGRHSWCWRGRARLIGSAAVNNPMATDELLRHFFGGFVRLYIFYHAEKEAICGVEMIEELHRHGYKLSPGTLYPILHQLEEAAYLSREEEVVSGKRRKNYRITKKGRKLLAEAQSNLRELFFEVVEDRDKWAATADRRSRSNDS
jgi:PadR family transcriptional regulator PadR